VAVRVDNERRRLLAAAANHSRAATTAAASRGGAPAFGTLYGGVNGTIVSSISAAAADVGESSDREAALEFNQGQAVPRFYKLEFPTYDGTVDPLNWINQCEQFFRGQRTLASDRTWLASYHLTGVAQTWYQVDRITDPTGDFPQRVGMIGWRRTVCRRADREGRRRATVPRHYSNTGTVHAGTVHAGGLRGTGG
jgi:hypothetical protein